MPRPRRCASILVYTLLAILCGSARAETTLRVMVFHPTGLPEAWRATRELADAFERDHPGVRVKLLPEGADALSKLRIMLAARQPLDVGIIDVVEFSAFLEDGVLLPLGTLLAQEPEWSPDDYFSIALDAFRDREGRLYGLPSTFTPYVLYYNQDLFDHAAIPYPTADWTWDDLASIAERLTDAPEQYGISITQWLQALAPWIWQNGGRYLDASATRSEFASPETVAAFRYLADLFHERRVASTDATYEGQLTRGLFQDGRVAMYGPVGYWEVTNFKAIDAFRWDVCPLPRGPGPNGRAATSIALRSYVAFSHTKHPQLATEFIRRLAGEPVSRALARLGNGVPGYRPVAFSDDFLKPDVLPESESVFLDVLESAQFLPVFANWRELESLVAEELQSCLLLGTLDAEAACRRMDEKVNAFLAREERRRNRSPAPWGTIAILAALVLAVAGAVTWRRRGPAPVGHQRQEERSAYRLIALWAVGFAVFTFGPMLASLVLSLTEWSPLRPLADARWVGLDHYARMPSDADFVRALEVTSAYALMSVPLTLALALALAVLVRRGSGVFRTLYYLPVIVSAVAAGLIWRWMYDSSVVEALLGAKWLETPRAILPGFVLMALWTVGAPMLIFLAGLQGIDRSLYDAARLDGAGRWRQFLHVTVPQLTPVILFNLVIGVINAFQTFAQPYVMTGGGPGNTSLFYLLYLFRNAFRFQRMGYASALGWILFVLLLALTLLLLRSSRRWVHYEGEAR